MVILKLIHAPIPDSAEGLCLLVTDPTQVLPGLVVNHSNRTNRIVSAGDESFKILTYQLPTVILLVSRAEVMINRDSRGH